MAVVDRPAVPSGGTGSPRSAGFRNARSVADGFDPARPESSANPAGDSGPSSARRAIREELEAFVGRRKREGAAPADF